MPSDPERPTTSSTTGDATASVPPAATVPDAAPRRSVPTTEAPSQVARRSISAAAWFALVTGVVVLIFMLIFILQNNVPTQFTFLAWTFTIPLGVGVLFAAIAGALITAMVGTVRMVVLGRSVRKLKHERAITG